jgi:pimeloyl-ACP methyl ester carboxylesterase
MPYAELADARLFYTDEGDGAPALLLVHGYTADSHDWSWQIPHFLPTHRVVAVDLRGHGRSSAPSGGYTTEQFAADLADLLDLLGIGQVVAMGHSMGGSVVSALAAGHPDRVSGVVAVDPAYLLPDATEAAMEPLLQALDETDPVPFVQQLVGGLGSVATQPALRTWQVRRIAGMEPHVLRSALRAQVCGTALHAHSAPLLRRRTCPVLSFYADPSRAAAEEEVFVDPRSRVVTWEGAGHWLHQERPEEFNALVTAWLATLG